MDAERKRLAAHDVLPRPLRRQISDRAATAGERQGVVEHAAAGHGAFDRRGRAEVSTQKRQNKIRLQTLAR